MRGASGADCCRDRWVSWSVNFHSVLVNMISISCILALGLFLSALGRDFHMEEIAPGVKRLQREFGTFKVRRSLEKRNAGLNEQTCTTLADTESVLQNSSHTVSDLCTCRRPAESLHCINTLLLVSDSWTWLTQSVRDQPPHGAAYRSHCKHGWNKWTSQPVRRREKHSFY